MKIFSIFGLLLWGFVTTSGAQPVSDESYIEAAKMASVQHFDPALPSLSMVSWVGSVAAPHSKVIWEVNDCGEQTGSPSDQGRDFPVCVEAIFVVSGGARAHVSIMVGTFKRGVSGQAELFQLFVKRSGEFRNVEKLSELPTFAE